MSTAAATRAATCAILCDIRAQRSSVAAHAEQRKPVRPTSSVSPIQRVRAAESGGKRIVLQPRLCTLRSYGSGDQAPSNMTIAGREEKAEMSSFFFASLADYVESARKSHDFEIISGRLAMVVFAAAVCIEGVTGDSLFEKRDLQQIAEAAAVCVAVVACAGTFAYLTSARARLGQMLTLSCNSFVDALIDNIVEALFSESELGDWSDDI